MREIIFRGKRESDGKWFFGNFTNVDDSVCMIHSGKRHHFVKRESVGQYTGLKDSKGNEIYEGDVIMVKEKAVITGRLTEIEVNKVVKYAEEYAQYLLCKGGSKEHLTFALSGEVIGNIHDNPELIKEDCHERN